ncbi:hypothetical protein QBC38DRAFT_461841 [Podospora fimiseda]|uniref:Uncharacterized protein n=1 Tax=Podospora fimiseda TaxID=252190 RepID=A0AAN7BF39_9PEZI|nr:hypothetical protein QBC38DRAFT_461841 [Podospora fimiseda]
MPPPVPPIYIWAKAEKHLLESVIPLSPNRYIIVARHHIKLAFNKGYISNDLLIYIAECMRDAAEREWFGSQYEHAINRPTKKERRRILVKLEFYRTIDREIHEYLEQLKMEKESDEGGYEVVENPSENEWEIL